MIEVEFQVCGDSLPFRAHPVREVAQHVSRQATHTVFRAKRDRLITGLEQQLSALHRIGIVTKAMEGELFALRNQFHRLFHSVEVEKVRSRTAGFQADLAKIRGRVAVIEAELNRRKLWGGGVVALLLAWGVLAWFLHRAYMEDLKSE